MSRQIWLIKWEGMEPWCCFEGRGGTACIFRGFCFQIDRHRQLVLGHDVMEERNGQDRSPITRQGLARFHS